MSRIRYAYFDIRAPLNFRIINEIGDVDFIVHCAAETDVDKSFDDPEPFVYSNFVGTYHMLEYARFMPGLRKFIQVSTDEVYGHAPMGTKYKEWDRLYPSNPYSATKAGADCLALAYEKSYRLPVTITRSMNNFGERQHIEGFIPTIIKSILDGKMIAVHGAKLGAKWRSGSRVWLHARNHADAIMFLIKNHKKFADKIVNIAGTEEVSNLDMVRTIGEIMNKTPLWKWVNPSKGWPGHDYRYDLDGENLLSMGWKPPWSFKNPLEKMVKWTVEHPRYLDWEG